MQGVFLSNDLYTTFIFFEVMSFASYPMVIHNETKEAIDGSNSYLGFAVQMCIRDSIMAVNMIGTKTLLMVCVLAVLLQESYLVDVAIVYALLSFLAVVVLSKLVITRYRVKKSEQKKTRCV